MPNQWRHHGPQRKKHTGYCHILSQFPTPEAIAYHSPANHRCRSRSKALQHASGENCVDLRRRRHYDSAQHVQRQTNENGRSSANPIGEHAEYRMRQTQTDHIGWHGHLNLLGKNPQVATHVEHSWQ